MHAQPSLAPPLLGQLRGYLPGLLLCGTIALAATFVSEHYGGPQFLYALLMGIAFHFLADSDKCQPGIEFAAKKLVRTGVALLGVRIAASDVAHLGLAGVGALAGAVVLTITFGLLLARLLRLPPALGLLSGGATGICGISAALAIASTLPATRENERYTLLTAIGIAAFSTLAMVLYPLLVSGLHLSTAEAGLFLGGSIHDVAQVVGAAFMISPQVGDAATLAKMFRVALLMPVVLALALHAGRRRGGGDAGGTRNGPLMPVFLLVFAALAAANSLGWLPAGAVTLGSELSRWCLVVSIAALGVKTSLEKLAELGWKPIALLSGEAVFVAGYMLLVVALMRWLAA
ncbi:YeiH family protein [Azohydromonas lata]|uniref:Sulfate exporter family transporter n=1 Tax=Azohydromonas lata TaxID=45677 RepID=A0ABU5INA2_9BURK|nr:putative sulfate exporter family transporter [Azohydromonas lata]MDZ5460377.1 putative sulfate exporter family transporter [Azohydromonas lata]